MNNIKDLMIFLIPGFIALSVAKFLKPECYKKTNWEEIGSILIFSIISYFISFLITGFKTCWIRMEELIKGTPNITLLNFVIALLCATIVGYLWGEFALRLKEKISGWLCGTKLKSGKSCYQDLMPFFNSVVSKHSGQWCEVNTKSGKTYLCEITKQSLPPDKEAMYITKISMLGEEGKTLDLAPWFDGIYLPYEEISAIMFRKPYADSERENKKTVDLDLKSLEPTNKKSKRKKT